MPLAKHLKVRLVVELAVWCVPGYVPEVIDVDLSRLGHVCGAPCSSAAGTIPEDDAGACLSPAGGVVARVVGGSQGYSLLTGCWGLPIVVSMWKWIRDNYGWGAKRQVWMVLGACLILAVVLGFVVPR